MEFLKKPVVRWIVFFPAAVIAAMLSIFVIRLFNGIWAEPPGQMSFWSAFGESIVSSSAIFVLMYVSALIAPSGKLVVTVVLATLLALLNLLGLYMAFIDSNYPQILLVIISSAAIIYTTKNILDSPPDLT
ncbi:hypothetical protein [Pseudomonas sp. Q2-TVG4-2]|uniref:hypothetical protein n=1 Tax=Pseudomonas sp. Q2-TVG4-2 TaxID=1685699 RepID=UPI0015E79D3B|nr:hypothetical protein [Pseudomonas sp. Q2-TVG4-2]